MKLKLTINKVVFTTTILPNAVVHNDLRYHGHTEENENWTVLIKGETSPAALFRHVACHADDYCACIGTVKEFKILGFSNRGGDVKHASGIECQVGETPSGESPILTKTTVDKGSEIS